VKRNADDRLAGRASPLVGKIAGRPELFQTLAIQLAMQLLHKALQRRAFQLEPQVTNGFAKDLLNFRRGFFKGGAQARSAKRLAQGLLPQQLLPAYLARALTALTYVKSMGCLISPGLRHRCPA